MGKLTGLLAILLFWSSISRADFHDLLCPRGPGSPISKVAKAHQRLSHLIEESHKFAQCEKLERVRQPEQYALCVSTRLRFIYERIYTWERVQKLRSVFERIKKISLGMLLEKAPIGENFFWAVKIENAIQRVQVNLDFPRGVDRQQEMEKLNAQTFPNHEIYLGGLLLLADENLEALFQVLAHEMGHVVGPTYTFRDVFLRTRAPQFPSYDGTYPFDMSLHCVGRKVLSPNFNCFDGVAEELMGNAMTWDLAKDVKRTSEMLKLNPYVSLVSSNLSGIACQAGQSEESFADFYGAEVTARDLSNTHGDLLTKAQRLEILQERMAFFCTHLDFEEANPQSGISRYPPMVTRINSLIYSHEQWQKAGPFNPNLPMCGF